MSASSIAVLLLTAITTVTAICVVRLLWILPLFRRPPPAKRKSSAKLVIVLGSGGHTAEMLRLVDSLDFNKYTRRLYMVSSGDTLSAGKAREFELRIGGASDSDKKADLLLFTVDSSHLRLFLFRGQDGWDNLG